MAWRFCVLVLALAAVPAVAQDKLALDGIAHVAFRVGDLPASREFYRKLGYEQAFEFSDAGGTTVSYMKVNDRQFIELYRVTAFTQALGLMHVCFDVHDVDTVHSEYAKRDLKPTATQKARAGNMLFTMLDPEGQLLEYTQYMPGSLHSNARGQLLGERRISDHLVRAAAGVKDLAAERAFYTGKLGFAVVNEGVTVRLKVAGASGEELDLEPDTDTWKPRITLAVTDLARTAADLGSRGIAARTGSAAVSITDPAGAIIEFIVVPSGPK
jgi:catechol 2,3-dioxygenase-like lactoylglutathione lyase family enzyme